MTTHAVTRADGPQRSVSLVDVMDRLLDRGIVIDAEVRVNVIGLNLAGVEARIVVYGIETYLECADAIASTPSPRGPEWSATRLLRIRRSRCM